MPDNHPVSNTSDNPLFSDIVTARASRRGVLAGSLGAAALTFVGANQAEAGGRPGHGHGPGPGPDRRHGSRQDDGRIGFTSIPLDDGPMPTIAPEYAYQVLIPWREKLDGSGDSYAYDGFTAEQQEKAIGIGHDGMWLFDDDILCINHEYGTVKHILGKEVPESLDEVRLMQAAHGVSVVALSYRRGTWSTRRDRRNRRIHVNSPVEFAGPARRSGDLVTRIGNSTPKGTVNNCSMGHTPWGTYLTCEENFDDYFGATDPAWQPNESQRRYGFIAEGQGYGWHLHDDRFDLAKNPNEEHRFGWVVEIDPNQPRRRPLKRTALGRFKHEGATVVEGRGKRVVVYSGDDERFEYVYKFVSADNWRSMFARGQHPLNEGTLYVARFAEDGTGEWLELSPDNPKLAGWNLEDILVKTRLAADILGATKMDRPEWITIGQNEEVFCTMTNNTRSTPDDNRPGNPPGPNPDGHIVRWVDSDRHTGTTFEWDFFAISEEVEDANGQMFGSPDGIWADQSGRIFVETDGDQPGGANDQLLVADQDTAEFKRLLTGVKGSEVTGLTVTASRRTLFANLQHPGEGDPAQTNFPAPFSGASGPVPRDATLVITRRNGGIVGS